MSLMCVPFWGLPHHQPCWPVYPLPTLPLEEASLPWPPLGMHAFLPWALSYYAPLLSSRTVLCFSPVYTSVSTTGRELLESGDCVWFCFVAPVLRSYWNAGNWYLLNWMFSSYVLLMSRGWSPSSAATQGWSKLTGDRGGLSGDLSSGPRDIHFMLNFCQWLCPQLECLPAFSCLWTVQTHLSLYARSQADHLHTPGSPSQPVWCLSSQNPLYVWTFLTIVPPVPCVLDSYLPHKETNILRLRLIPHSLWLYSAALDTALVLMVGWLVIVTGGGQEWEVIWSMEPDRLASQSHC